MTEALRADAPALKRAVIYLRVSTRAQAETDYNADGYSIQAQREACLRKAEALGALVLDEYIDRGESAKSADRPAFQAMLARIAAERDVDYVVVHKVDRWARNREDDVLINMRIRKSGATLVSATENIDQTPSGRFLHSIMAGMAEFYSANLATEVMKGTTQKAKNGGTPHQAPVGYLNIRQLVEGREVRTIAIDQERAPLVRWAFEKYATGRYSTIQLTDMLAERGLTSRPTRTRRSQPLARSRVLAMLHNSYYVGVVTYRGVQYDGRHEPIVSPELFARVQQVLRAHEVAGDRQRTHNHYLKGSLRCKNCRSRMIITNARGHLGRHYLYFFCSGRQRRNGCLQPYVPVEECEAEVIRLYGSQQLTPEEAAALRAAIQADLEKKRANQDQVVVRERARLTRLDAKRSKLLEGYYAGAIPVDLLRRDQEQIAREMAEARHRLTMAESRLTNAEQIILQTVDLLAHLQAAYRDAPSQVRRMFNQALFKRLEVDGRCVIGGEVTELVDALLAHEVVRRVRRQRTYERTNPGLVLVGQGSSRTNLVEAPGIEPDGLSDQAVPSRVRAFPRIRRPSQGGSVEVKPKHRVGFTFGFISWRVGGGSWTALAEQDPDARTPTGGQTLAPRSDDSKERWPPPPRPGSLSSTRREALPSQLVNAASRLT